MFESLKKLAFPCLVVSVVFLFYWRTVGAYFNDNDLNEFKNVLTYADKWYINPTYWRPVWHLVNHLAIISFGLNPLPYHLIIITLYLVFLGLLYHLYTQVIEDRAVAKIALILFATFYLHAEVVSRFVCLAELLWPLFGLSSLLLFLYYRKTKRLSYYFLSILSALMGSLSKETAVSLPLLILSLDLYMGSFPFRERGYRLALLPYVPFFVIALTLAILCMLVPPAPFLKSQILPYYGPSQIPLLLLKQGFYLAFYIISPCFFGTKLNPLFTLVIVVLTGWVFYTSSQKMRNTLVVILACLLWTTFPYTPVGIVPRYTFFPSVFSSLLLAVLIFEISRRTYAFSKERLGLRNYLPENPGVAVISYTLILPLVYLNYQYVQQYGKNCVWAGKLVREIVEGTARIFPDGPGKSRVFYINLPNRVQSEMPFNAIIVSFGEYTYIGDIVFYYLFHKINGPMGLTAVNIDLGYKKVGSPSAWYDLCETARRISPEEYSALAGDRENTVLFFNPLTEKLVDVGGWNYRRLAESVANISTHALN